ncbi:MAG: hypothetical protein CME36_03790 [unclassified Hahellaceae]|nr:hypothetical protein [Hahellaceae bacterium]|tara:strand:+ start:6977 stop:7201 length:225 start_codon:yes stop_codon:yes gene_type:complete
MTAVASAVAGEALSRQNYVGNENTLGFSHWRNSALDKLGFPRRRGAKMATRSATPSLKLFKIITANLVRGKCRL